MVCGLGKSGLSDSGCPATGRVAVGWEAEPGFGLGRGWDGYFGWCFIVCDDRGWLWWLIEGEAGCVTEFSGSRTSGFIFVIFRGL